MKPKEAVIAVTYRCNARCSMCNIWKNPEVEGLAPDQYLKLPNTLKTINVTGGEPFLRKDLVEVVKNIHKRVPDARLVFSTNGFRTDLITSTMKQIRNFHEKVGVGVSIDGLEATHEKVRGVPGVFKNAVSTIQELRRIGIRDLRIGMTLQRDNVDEAHLVFNLSKELGVQFTTTFAHNSEVYFQKMDNAALASFEPTYEALHAVLNCQLRSRSAKDWLRAYHTRGILDKSLREEFISKCEAGRRFFFMSPSGDVFPCMVMNMPIGNIRDVRNWDELFSDNVETKVAKAVKACKEDCWMVCNTRSLIVAHPFRAGAWVVKSKAKAHFGNRGKGQSARRS